MKFSNSGFSMIQKNEIYFDAPFFAPQNDMYHHSRTSLRLIKYAGIKFAIVEHGR